MPHLPGYIASGYITRARFVTRCPGLVNTNTGTAYCVQQSTTGDIPVGVGQVEVNAVPGGPNGSNDPGYAASPGQTIRTYRVGGEGAELELGGSVTAGQFLKPDSVGRGVLAGVGDYYGARAEENGVSGDVIVVEVLIGKY